MASDVAARLAHLGGFVRGVSLRSAMDEGLANGLTESDYPTVDEDRLVLGLLWEAAGHAVDGIASELRDLLRAEVAGTAVDWDDFFILGALPARFRSHFSVRFATDFFVALADVASKLAHCWSPPSCVAQELAVNSIIVEARVLVDRYELGLYERWETDLREYLFEDTDYEMLHDMRLDGFENEQSDDGVVPMRFEDWFTPYDADHPITPALRGLVTE